MNRAAPIRAQLDPASPTAISLEGAVLAGLKRYFTGVPCARGHVAPRRVLGRHCVECHNEDARRHRRAAKVKPASASANTVASHPATAGHDTGGGWPSREAMMAIFPVVTLEEAITVGEKRYFTGQPCKYGHIDQRSVANGSCITCACRSTNGSYVPRERALRRLAARFAPGPIVLPEWPRISRDDARAAGLKRFFDGMMCDRGHVSRRQVGNLECVACANWRHRDRYATDPEFRRHRIAYEVERNRRPEVRERRLEKAAIYHRLPRVRKRLLDRVKFDPLFKLNWNVKTLLRAALKKHRHKKSSRLHDILGCSVTEFKEHLQRQFTAGMSWSKHGRWEIDHIVSLSTATNGEDTLALFHHTNMRPLWKAENRAKGSRVTHLI